jgi:hypothetical protein
VLVVQDTHPFMTDHAWLHDFGNLLKERS